MQVKLSQAQEIITAAIRANLVPMLIGSPGCGKSQAVQAIADDYGLKLIDLRLAQCDPTDLAGFPTVEGGKSDYMPMKHFPIEGDPVPKGYNGWLLFLDEANSAPQAIQAAAYKLILDRMVGSHHLHKKVAIVAAGNLDTDNAIVQPLSTALQSRLVHLELMVDHEEWVEWAEKKGIYHRITDFIKFKPSNLFTFKPDHTDKTYACPRTWAFADGLLKVMSADSDNLLPALAGTLSEGVAREFLTFCKIYDRLPKLADILKDPSHAAVPEEPSVLFALTGSMADSAKKETLNELVTYLKRIPAEFQVVCLRSIIRKHKDFMEHPAINGWITTQAKLLF